MMLTAYIIWLILGVIVIYCSYVWKDEQIQNFENRFFGSGFCAFSTVFLIPISLGVLWPVLAISILTLDKKVKIKNPVRWAVREIQNPKKNI